MRQQQGQPRRRASTRRRMTQAERSLWSRLGDASIDGAFGREVTIGPYRVAFASAVHRLAIEVQRGQGTGEFPNPPRAMALECRGWRVLQFGRREVLESGGRVVHAIRDALAEAAPGGTAGARAAADPGARLRAR